MPDAGACVFARAVLAQAAGCSLSRRRQEGEREWVACGAAPARLNCATLAALLRERARFALKLPADPEAPLLHAQALRLQCGGLQALAVLAGQPRADDVHALREHASQAHGGLMELPWPALVQGVRAWQPRRRSGARQEDP